MFKSFYTDKACCWILLHNIVIPACLVWLFDPSQDDFILHWISLTIIIAFKSHPFVAFLFYYIYIYIRSITCTTKKIGYLHTAMQTTSRTDQSLPQALIKTAVMFWKSSAVLLADWEVPEHSTASLTVYWELPLWLTWDSASSKQSRWLILYKTKNCKT